MLERRSFLKKCSQALALAGFGSLGHQVLAGPPVEVKKEVFVHAVYFWMKAPDNALQMKAFREGMIQFVKDCKKAKLFIREPHIGIPAQTPREVVDNSYHFSLVVTFKDKEGHDAYQVHPIHKKFVEKTKDLWSKVQIYDSIEII